MSASSFEGAGLDEYPVRRQLSHQILVEVRRCGQTSRAGYEALDFDLRRA